MARTIKKHLIYVDPFKNSNKHWKLEATERTDGMWDVVCSWGRVKGDGTFAQNKPFVWSERKIWSKISEQQGDGYVELELAQVPVSIGQVSFSPRIGQLVDWIKGEAGQAISQYAVQTLDQLSANQIQKARSILKQIEQHGREINLVADYYRAIPTKLSHKINASTLVLDFDVREQTERLDQLNAAVQFTANAGSSNLTDLLGADLVELDPQDANYREIKEILEYHDQKDPKQHNVRIWGIFKVTQPKEFEIAFRRDLGNVQFLTHGTKADAVAHILRGGLDVAHCSSSSIFGKGIYHANYAPKSYAYTYAGARSQKEWLFVNEVALGNAYISPAEEKYRQPPSGYDSVWGKKDVTGYSYRKLHQDEFIVYKNDRVLLRYLVVGNWS